MKKQLLLLLTGLCLLAGCGETNGLPTIDDVDHTVIEELEDCSSGIIASASGFLNEISLGIPLAGHSSYPITFSLTDNPTDVINVYTDNPNVLTVETNESKTIWTLKTHKQGQSHLIIEDGDTIIHYRKVVTVKKKLSEEEATEKLYKVDHYMTDVNYSSTFGTVSMVFMDDGTGYISGTESGGVTFKNESFTYSYDPTYDDIAEDHDNWYIYKISNWKVSDLVLDYFAVWNTGDILHLHSNISFVGIFNPIEEE